MVARTLPEDARNSALTSGGAVSANVTVTLPLPDSARKQAQSMASALTEPLLVWSEIDGAAASVRVTPPLAESIVIDLALSRCALTEPLAACMRQVPTSDASVR
jgi:predicted outer membrane repeat protein